MTSGDLGRLLLRLAVGGLMLFHGIHKLRNGVAGIESTVVERGLPAALTYGVYAGEVVAPALILLGVLVRPAAVLVAINMVVAVALTHTGDFARLGKGGAWALELQAFYFLVAVALALLDGGRVSVVRSGGGGKR